MSGDRKNSTSGAGRGGASGASDFQNRRKKADWVVRMATILSFISWLVAFAVLFPLDRASPEREHMFTRMFGIQVREHWDVSLLPISFGLLIAALCICIAAFIFNMQRMRRKTDKYRKSIIIIGSITIVGIVFFLVQFGSFFLW